MKNKTSTPIYLIVLVFLASVFLAACGGGGDDGDGGGSSASNFSSSSIFNDAVSAIALAENSDDIYVGGDFTAYNGTNSNRIIRLNSDGSVDTGFDIGTGFNSRVRSIAAANDGSGDIYVGGSFSSYNGVNNKSIIRLNSDGSIDTGFNVGSGFNGAVYCIAVASSGSIYAGGDFTNYRGSAKIGLVRIKKNGDNDNAGFNVGSGFGTPVAFNDGVVLTLATDDSGNIYAGGSFTTYRGNARNFITRINNDGSDDASFVTGTGFDDVVTSITVATDGSGDIFAGGSFSVYRGNSRVGLARIKSNGSNDASFAVGSGFDSSVRSVAVATDGSGDIFASGYFSIYRGNARVGLARISEVGSNDANFGVGTGLDSYVLSIAVATDGSGDIYVGGGFTSHGATNVGYFARLDSVGQLR